MLSVWVRLDGVRVVKQLIGDDEIVIEFEVNIG